MRPSRVRQFKYHKSCGIVLERKLKIILISCPTYAKAIYRRNLHPSYMPWIQVMFNPILSRKMGRGDAA